MDGFGNYSGLLDEELELVHPIADPLRGTLAAVEFHDAAVLHLHHLTDEFAHVAILVRVEKRLCRVSKEAPGGIGVHHVAQLLAAIGKLAQRKRVNEDSRLRMTRALIDDILNVCRFAVGAAHNISDIGEAAVALQQLMALEPFPRSEKYHPPLDEPDPVVGDTVVDLVVKPEITESQDLPHVILRP